MGDAGFEPATSCVSSRRLKNSVISQPSLHYKPFLENSENGTSQAGGVAFNRQGMEA